MINVYSNTYIANHLWQSTFFAGLAWLLAWALRHNHARTRHWVWLMASVKFLVPFSLLMAIGGQLGPLAERFTSRRAAHTAWPALVEQIGQPFARTQNAAPVTAVLSAPQEKAFAADLLLTIWACGCAVVLFSWWRRWRSIRVAVLASSPVGVEFADGIPVMSSPAAVEPGIFGILRPVLLLPEGIADHLAPAHLEAILAHEMCHVRRRDNLAAAIHMVVEAVFWFHPLVWWIGARLVEERERACDEEVLRLGKQPEIYAESILKTCQFYLESPLACVSGISGSDLKKRIMRIMTPVAAVGLGTGKRLLLAGAALVALAGPLVFGLLNAPASRAQATPKFDVASIKPNHNTSEIALFRLNAEPGKFAAEHVTVKFLVRMAYQVDDSQVVGGPGWADSEHYDIQAKQDDAAADELRKINREEQMVRQSLMLQGLLADRFKLVIHHETREQPIYALVVANSGAKLRASATAGQEVVLTNPPDPTGPQPPHSFRMMGSGNLTVVAQNMDRFATLLSHQVRRLVVNETGLKGEYDFTLQWSPTDVRGMMPGAPAAPDTAADTSGPSIFTALHEQLGLKLESRKGPVDTIVIDSVERPTEN